MDMFLLAQSGDCEALSSLIRLNIRLVQSLCTRFEYSEDAFQQGCIGLLHAIRHYQPDSGAKFSTYAVPCILGEIRRTQYAGLNWRGKKVLRSIKTIREKLISATGREPSIDELSSATGISVSDLMILLEKSRTPVSIDQEDALLYLPDPYSFTWLDRFFLKDILERLPSADKRLLYFRFTLNHSQIQTAHCLQMTQPAVSRMEKRVCGVVRLEWIGEA